ncbi:MAG TPA: ammonium transporter [Pirellulales bacterium]|jgi:Amt family ammonium transporter
MRLNLVRYLFVGALLAIVFAAPRAAFAQEKSDETGAPQQPVGPGMPDPVANPPSPPRVLDRGDNAWVLTSSALVLMMTTPGLAMFYGGLVRKKNVVSVLMQCVFLMGMMSVLWATVGYSLAFGGTYAENQAKDNSPWIGNGQYFWMNGVQAFWNDSLSVSVVPMHPTLNIPFLSHMLFQGMFFIITPGLICGAFAERMKFSTMAVFSGLWGLLIYCPLCHMVWGGGAFAYDTAAAAKFCAGGALDFAGGTVVHISSGVSALVCALFLGAREGYPKTPMPPHNLTYTAIGAGLLWVGWFGFNAGSALAADGIASGAFAATHFSAAAGAVVWALIEYIHGGKATLLGASSGLVAGLVCITPAAGHVLPMAALAMGAIAGLVCYVSVAIVKPKLGYDDSLDAFGVHGVGGTLGAILTGVFATRAAFDIGKGKPLGLIENGSVIKGQLIATGATWAFAAVGTVVLLTILKATMGLRVSRDEEMIGLDQTEHHEEGYIFI